MDIFDLIQQGKVKRYFRAREKISYPGAISHITQRAPGKEMLFIEERDYLFMLYLIKVTVKKFNLKFFSFVLMPNHVHFLFQLKKNNLSSSFQYLFYNYARYFNNKYGRKGHVFCDRFRQALCFDESYLLASSVYIHMNPFVAGLTKSISDYRWSSIIPFIKKFNKKTFIDYHFVLSILNKDINMARQIYKQLIDRSIEIKIGNLWDNPKAIELFRDKFIIPLKGLLNRSNRFESVLSFDSEIEGTIKKKYQRNPETTAARAYLIEQLLTKGYKISDIAEKLNVTRQTIHKILKNK